MVTIKDKSLLREAAVVSVIDDQAGLRIKVRFDYVDGDSTKTEDLPYCFPLLPKHLQIAPKVGERVLVITDRLDVPKSRRWFIGPVISQQYKMDFDPYLSADCLLDKDNTTKPLPNPDLNPENEGSYPEREDIALQGRKNTDLILKDNEVRLRCGFKKDPNTKKVENKLLFNRTDLSYIQMKYKRLKDKKGNTFNSSINIVADRINLLSHDSRTPFTLNNRKDLITDGELIKIVSDAHPMVYGDNLIEFLKQLIEVIRTHTHPFSMDPPCFTTPQTTVLDTNLDEMLSESIRIN